MKGFLIFMALLVGGSVYFFTHTAEIAKDAIAQLEADEKPDLPGFQELMYRDPAAFAVAYKPFLDKRAQIGKWMGILGEGVGMEALCERTRDLYHDSSLATDPSYGDMLYRSIRHLDDQNAQNFAQQAFDLCRVYQNTMPDGPHREEINGIATRLQYKFNFK